MTGFSEIGSHELFVWGWLRTMILLISASCVARIIGTSHQHLALSHFFKIFLFLYWVLSPRPQACQPVTPPTLHLSVCVYVCCWGSNPGHLYHTAPSNLTGLLSNSLHKISWWIRLYVQDQVDIWKQRIITNTIYTQCFSSMYTHTW
jgi:hypothetical protein